MMNCYIYTDTLTTMCKICDRVLIHTIFKSHYDKNMVYICPAIKIYFCSGTTPSNIG